jgi:hypothetical protein
MKYLLALPLLAALTGCDLSYHGTAPNVRTFSEEPALSQYYIGFDLEFVVVDPPTDPDQPAVVREPQAPEDEEDLPRELPGPRFLD